MPFLIPRATRNRLLAIGLLAFCALCIGFPHPWHQRLRGLAQAAAGPPRHILANAHDTLQGLLRRLGDLWASAQEVERLRQENLALRQAIARLGDQAHHTSVQLRSYTEIEQFRRRTLQRPLRIVPASVVAVDASPWRHALVVDRGARSGLCVGTPAVYGTSIVGIVVATRPTAATVRLLTDSRCGITARVVGTDEVGLLRGAAEPNVRLRLKWIHLQRPTPATPGARVVTSGLDPAIPPGLLAGWIVEVSTRRQPLFYDIKVRPDIDLDRLTEILLLVHPHDDVSELLELDQKAKPR